MEKLNGTGVSKGVVRGRLHFFSPAPAAEQKRPVADPAAELERYKAARDKAVAELGALYEKTKETLGEENAALFEIHQMMLQDADYNEAVENTITGEKANAEYAVYSAGQAFAADFASMDDDYMKARAADVVDISQRVARILRGEEEAGLESAGPVILAADDLKPSETARLDKNQVLAFVTAGGSSNSHTAIFARTLGIPAVVGLGGALKKEYDGMDAFVDGAAGEVVVRPDEVAAKELEARAAAFRQNQERLAAFKGKPTRTKNGKELLICANIGSPKDIELVLENDAEGIGLFRSEFLYLESADYPTEEAQFEAYKQVAEALGTRQVVIRTLDIGADKQADYFQLPHEENPALGMRAIRICLTRPEVFKTQLRALYRASVYGNLAIMFPMITSLDEIRRIKEIVEQVKAELTQKNAPFKADLPLGIMIETPAAAVISDLLAPHVDFFSVGTNDLTQYTLAIDRQNASVEPFRNTHHEAVLRLIRFAAESAHKNKIWIGICGELGADETLTETFLEMGIDELSVNPASVLGLRARVAEIEV